MRVELSATHKPVRTLAERWAAVESALAAKMLLPVRKPTARQLKLAKAYGPYALEVRWNAGKLLVEQVTGGRAWIPLVDHTTRGNNPGAAVVRPLYLDYKIQDPHAAERQSQFLNLSPGERPTAVVEFIFHGKTLEELEVNRAKKADARLQAAAEAAWEAATSPLSKMYTKEEYIVAFKKSHPNIPHWLR